ncbi:MAG TPA: o-succinylbenzoate synthase [Acidobacteriota bacterium]|nr:o-succinylbenzoate synthase [Acidobacteriota bacterium]
MLNALLQMTLPKIERVTLMLFRLPLRSPFETSFGSIDHREIVLCEIDAGGLKAYGESASDVDPLYSYETNFTCWQVLERYLIPTLANTQSIADYLKHASPIRGHNMAKATLEGALWDLLARAQGKPLFRLWNGVKDRIPCGVSVGLQKDTATLLDTIRGYLSKGYRRIKIKIKPGKDHQLLEAIRKELPDVPLMADANAAYTLSDVELLKSLDQFRLMMIEQPLHFEDIYEHSFLQSQINTPVCLDESVISAATARAAIELKSCRIINIKTGRVGGHSESIRIHDLAESNGIPVWCGGMLESGIGRAHNLALASLRNFSLPGDTSASDRYWHRDVIHPAVEIDAEGYAHLPEKPGIGYDVDSEFLCSLVYEKKSYVLNSKI